MEQSAWWFVELSDGRYVHLSRCDRFQDVLMLECRIGLCAEQTKRVVIECLRRGCNNYIKKRIQMSATMIGL